MSVVTDEMFDELLGLFIDSLTVREKYAEAVQAACDRLLNGGNQYRVAHLLQKITSEVEHTNVQQRERAETFRAILREHAPVRPSEQGDPRGDADNGR